MIQEHEQGRPRRSPICMYIYIYVCMYVCMHVCMYAYQSRVPP
jgi:hypothetical protein